MTISARDHNAPRITVVTGASRGLGLALAANLIAHGHRVVANSRSLSADLKDLLNEYPDQCHHVRGDIAEETTAQKIAQVVNGFEGDVTAIHNAGVCRDRPIVNMSVGEWDYVLNTNLRGAFVLAKHLLKPMMRRRYGRFIFVSSIAAITGNKGQANYAASKAGLEGLSMTVAQEYAKFGVRTVVVAPGPLDIGLGAKLGPSAQEVLFGHSLLPDQNTSSTLKMLGFLASEAADYVNATTIRCDGGVRY